MRATPVEARLPARNRMVRAIIVMLVLGGGSASAQRPAPPGTDRVAFAAKRFPQPVRVGDLIGRDVLQPLESRPLLGRVQQVVRTGDERILIVMSYGGVFGFGRRRIAVPVEAMVLVGTDLEVLDFTPAQLDAFASYDADGTTALGADQQIRMGLAHPSH